jgi:hypothetical protein
MTKIIDRKIEITINNKQHLFINMRLAKLQVYSHKLLYETLSQNISFNRYTNNNQ